MFFVTSYGGGGFGLIPLLSTIVMALGPIGFCWFFFRKLGTRRGMEWVGLFVAAVVTAWFVIFVGAEMESRYLGYSFEQEFPALVLAISIIMGIALFALLIGTVVFLAKKYAKYRGERLEELEEDEESPIFSPRD